MYQVIRFSCVENGELIRVVSVRDGVELGFGGYEIGAENRP